MGDNSGSTRVPASPGGMSLERWCKDFPILDRVRRMEPVFWVNPGAGGGTAPLSLSDILDADARLRRFAPFIAATFPETAAAAGIIESELRPVPMLRAALASGAGTSGEGRGTDTGFLEEGRLLFKLDNELPVSGSIKARGGIYEVLKQAETLALEAGLVTGEEDYAVFASGRFRRFFAGYSIAVGSTGNLGLSIGIMGAALGFRTSVHMSSDAKEWKKALLRERGVEVVEYAGDYSLAVEQGREASRRDPRGHFVDDENSTALFLGYAVAALRLKEQLKTLNIRVDSAHPLFVYLPCGVGGGPGGIAFGLKTLFGTNVHCFFAEPTAAPCMLLGLATGLHDGVSVADFGLSGKTIADGLAVGRPSGLVGREYGHFIDGVFTVEDARLLELLKLARRTEKLRLEPSALAGLPGPSFLRSSAAGREWLKRQGLEGRLVSASHIVWATGGGMVPDEVLEGYLQ